MEGKGKPVMESPLIPSSCKSYEDRDGEGEGRVVGRSKEAVVAGRASDGIKPSPEHSPGNISDVCWPSWGACTLWRLHGYVLCGVTGFSIVGLGTKANGLLALSGLASALDTFCGQAYGAKQYHTLGTHMQRAILVLMLVSIPLAGIWAYTGQILLFFGQDPEVSREAGLYARWMIQALFAYGLLHSHNRFLQTQNIVLPMMLISGLTALLHILVCWILVFKSGLGSKVLYCLQKDLDWVFKRGSA